MAETGYRARLYDTYVQARESMGATSLDDIATRTPYLRKLVRTHFPPSRDAHVLDLGCGHGSLLHVARGEGYQNVEGIDVSPEQVELAERLGIAGVRHGDVMDEIARCGDGVVDVVITFDVIEHLQRPELLSLADEVFRILAAGGRWIIHTPNAESPLFGRIRYGDLTHEQAFTRESVKQFLRPAGFARIYCFEDSPVVHGVRSAARALVWRGIRGLLRVYLAAETGNTGREAIFSQNFLTVAHKVRGG
ncbi:MAG TPA: class I SAM-dependent methyltransferase [Gemmatimonadaceae bacterium]|nr:class I SAM-dependent methyltransferase [Gemmatimonadaceae bacterium]